MDAAYELSTRACLIHPARFLTGSGRGLKEFSEKRLKDPHFKVIHHEINANNVFPNADIKGGVAITYRDATKDFGAIEIFIPIPELATIFDKVKKQKFSSLQTIIYPPLSYDVSEKMKEENPQSADRLRTSCFTTLAEIFYNDAPDDNHQYVRLLGLIENKRVYKWVRRDYITDKYSKLDKYEVIVPEANGSGALGEVISTPLIGQPLIGQPLIGHTQSFMTIGCFDTQSKAEACLKYVKSKFARALLGILKITQHNPPKTWKYVPLQDFTDSSDIDWSVSVAEVDQQLYAKYGLSEEEIDFIESKVRAMD